MNSEALKDKLQHDLNEGQIEIKTVDVFDVFFELTTPFAGFTNGKLWIDEQDKIKLTINSCGDLVVIPFVDDSVISSIRKSSHFKYNVLKLYRPQAFVENFLQSFIAIGQCHCPVPVMTDTRLLAVDLSYPSVPRERGIVTTTQCGNPECSRWRFDTHTFDGRGCRDMSQLKLNLIKACDELGITIPSNKDSIHTSMGIAHKKKAIGTSKRSIEAKKRLIAKFKDLSLQEIKSKEYQKPSTAFKESQPLNNRSKMTEDQKRQELSSLKGLSDDEVRKRFNW